MYMPANRGKPWSCALCLSAFHYFCINSAGACMHCLRLPTVAIHIYYCLPVWGLSTPPSIFLVGPLAGGAFVPRPAHLYLARSLAPLFVSTPGRSVSLENINCKIKE